MLFYEYINNPLRHLREVGLQSRLREIIQNHLGGSLPVNIITTGKKSTGYSTKDTIDRTVLEAKISNKEATDVVVLKNDGTPITNTLWPNGHLDIIAKIDIASVDAAIEIKASCSADGAECLKFINDINKLLKLTHPSGSKLDLERHFLLFDKSISIKEHASCNKNSKSSWHTVTLSSMIWKLYPMPPTNKNTPFVNVWLLDSSGSSVVHQYAY